MTATQAQQNSPAAEQEQREAAQKDSFRLALRRMASSVSIISAADGQTRAGMTASSVTSLSFDPLSLLVCIHRQSRFYEIVSQQDTFCINLLDQAQADISDKFSRPTAENNLFDNGDWQWHDGLPYLKGAQANLFLDIKDRHTFGTHSIVIGEVKDVFYADQVSPLIYLDGSYLNTGS